MKTEYLQRLQDPGLLAWVNGRQFAFIALGQLEPVQRVVAVVESESCSYDVGIRATGDDFAEEIADHLNAELGVSPADARLMALRSMSRAETLGEMPLLEDWVKEQLGE